MTTTPHTSPTLKNERAAGLRTTMQAMFALGSAGLGFELLSGAEIASAAEMLPWAGLVMTLAVPWVAARSVMARLRPAATDAAPPVAPRGTWSTAAADALAVVTRRVSSAPDATTRSQMTGPRSGSCTWGLLRMADGQLRTLIHDAPSPTDTACNDEPRLTGLATVLRRRASN